MDDDKQREYHYNMDLMVKELFASLGMEVHALGSARKAAESLSTSEFQAGQSY